MIDPKLLKNYKKVNYTGKVGDLLEIVYCRQSRPKPETRGDSLVYTGIFQGQEICLMIDHCGVKTRFPESRIPLAVLYARDRKTAQTLADRLGNMSAQLFRTGAEEYLTELRAKKASK